MRGVTMTKVVGICFGLFALMAISTSTGSRQSAAKAVKLEQPAEKTVDVRQRNTVDLPAGTDGSVAQENSVSERTGGQTEAISTVAVESKKQIQDPTTQNKDVRVSISINVHKEEEAAKTAKVLEEVKETAVKEEAKPVEKKEEEVKVVEKEVKLPEVPVKAAAQPKPTKVVKPASASVLVIPILAMAAALVAVKVRKPGYLPEAVEDKLESMGFPAQQRSSQQGSWKTSSRSMYGSV